MFLYSSWASLSLATRNKIAETFGIKKTGPTEVFANTIKSDGYAIKDIETVLTLSALQKYLGTTETDHTVLWNYLVDKIEGKNIQIVDTPVTIKVYNETEELKKRPGRPKKVTNETETHPKI